MNYSDKLKDPRWQKKRLEILNRDGFACLACDDEKSTLHVHHCYYVSKREPWDYPNESLLTFCAKCHKDVDEDVDSRASFITRHWERAAVQEMQRVFLLKHEERWVDLGVLSEIHWTASQKFGKAEADRVVEAIEKFASYGLITPEFTRYILSLCDARDELLKRCQEAMQNA